jgi:mRNA-degrading endonuclease HigB of HigAB toxin-antitoxin module
VISRATSRFWEKFRDLPSPIQHLARRSYRLWRENPHHPSLRFRKLEGVNLYTVRVGNHHRALAMVNQKRVTWTWIGTHAEYDKLVGN